MEGDVYATVITEAASKLTKKNEAKSKSTRFKLVLAGITRKYLTASIMSRKRTPGRISIILYAVDIRVVCKILSNEKNSYQKMQK